MTVVMALGGNALVPAGERGSAQEQQANADRIARAVAAVASGGRPLVLTHGNGPQVGNLALQQEAGIESVPSLPLSTLVAMTQGQLGSLMALALRAAGIRSVASIVTHVIVAPDDPAFEQPTKPVGPFFSLDQAMAMAAERGWTVAEDAGRGWRRMVASPQPREVVEVALVRELAATGAVVVAAGGGGVPVVTENGRLVPIDGVVDKDLAAAVLATALDASTLVLLTNVPAVVLHFGTSRARPLEQLTLVEALGHLAAGRFAAGSMAPKVAAAAQFLGAGGESALITDAEHLGAGLAGEHGTRLVRGSRPPVRSP